MAKQDQKDPINAPVQNIQVTLGDDFTKQLTEAMTGKRRRPVVEEKPEKTFDDVTFEKNSPFDKELLDAIRESVVVGSELREGHANWIGSVKLNKDVMIRVSRNGKKAFRKIPGGKEEDMDVKTLTHLVRRAIQEGPEDMRYNIMAHGDKPRNVYPLEIQIVRSSYNEADADDLYVVDPKKAPLMA